MAEAAARVEFFRRVLIVAAVAVAALLMWRLVNVLLLLYVDGVLGEEG